MNSYRIVLADDHILLRHGLKSIIESSDGFEVIAEADDGAELLSLLHKVTPDLVILDISMPKIRGLEAAAEISKNFPDIKTLILTMHKGSQYLHHALSAGVDGYLLKEDAPKEIFTAIDTIRQGRKYISPLLLSELTDEMARAYQTGEFKIMSTPLTLREREVLKLIAEEKTNKEIAELLSISLRTVHHHRASLMQKLNIHKTAGLVRYAIKNEYVD
ncbi:MAG: response regulator transcription factor [Deltaproteobacteria bacterium]|nr:response regulator transcription factor [Deltaproteobacteria bacterium]